MGWFGVLETDKTEAFRNLFCQKQYKGHFELLWEKHLSSRSIAVYSLDGISTQKWAKQVKIILTEVPIHLHFPENLITSRK